MFKKLLTYSILSLVGMMGLFGSFSNGTISKNSSVENTISFFQNTYAVGANDGNAGEAEAKAAMQTKTTDQNAEMQKMLNSLVGGLNIILDILTIIVSPAIMLASWLMSPDWTSGDLFGIRPALHSLWVTVSNIVYFIYAILLIFIALATIFNSQNYGYKQLLPKLALGVILVPLTWWFVQFTISLSTYITASVISIPMETLAKYSQPGSFWNTPSIPKKIIYENSKVLNEDSKEIDKDTVLCGEDKGKCVSPESFIKTSGGMYSPLLVYSFSVFKFHEVKKLKKGSDVVYAIGDIIHQGIIGVIMFIVYGLLVVALIFMLLMRAVKLWFYAIFSPLFTIKYVLGDKGFGDADKDGSFKITEFIGLAFVPAVVSLALSFGLIIISVMHAGGTNSGSASSNSKCEGEKCTLTIMGTNSIVSTTTGEGNNKKSVTTVNIGGDKDENRISYEFKGSVQGGEPILGSVTSALGSTGNLFGTIILDIIALIFIWIAFMAGKGVSKAAGKAIEPFEQMGNKLGSLGASLPKYAPIPGLGMSASSLSKVPQKIESGIETKSNQIAAESSLGKLVGLDGELSADYARVKQALKAETATINDVNAVRQNSAKIIAKKGLGSLEGQEAMEDLKKIAIKNPELKAKIENVDLQKNGQITKAGLKLLEGQLTDSSGWLSDLESEKNIKEWKEKRSNYNGSTGGSSGTTGGSTLVGAAKETTTKGDFNINIQQSTVSFKQDSNGKMKDISGLDGLKGKKSGKKKDEFLQELKTNGNLSEENSKLLLAALEKIDGFFEK